jgi:hypothetical protein
MNAYDTKLANESSQPESLLAAVSLGAVNVVLGDLSTGSARLLLSV